MNFKKDLLENILPFWLNNAIDYENGGIYTCLDREGNIYGTEKSVWFQGRSLWVLSKAYNTISKNKEYLKASECIYNFLPKCTDTDGRMFFTVTCDGREIQKRRYYFSETFAAIGCAEYYVASGNRDALLSARKYFDVAYDCFTDKLPQQPKFNGENHSYKALSPVMIMLSTAQTMRDVDKENFKRYNDIAKHCLNEILNGGFLTDKALFENVLTDGTTANTPTGRTINPGHSMEAAWFVMLEGIKTNNQDAINAGKKIIDITLPLGLDKKHGGLIAFCDSNGMPPMQLEWDMKLWWPQCETMIAMRMAYSIFKDEKYNTLYNQFKDYCKNNFVDSEHGEWYGYLHYDNTPSTYIKGNIFKGPFHIPRLYIIMALMDEEYDLKNY